MTRENLKASVLWAVIALVGVLAVGGLVLAFSGSTNRVIENVEVYNEAPAQASQTVSNDELGALASPIIPFHYLEVGSVRSYYYGAGMKTASTTVCVFDPPSATSTLVAFDFQITTGTSTAATMVLATSTLFSATTTSANISGVIVPPASKQYSANILPTTNKGIIGPKEYLLLITEGVGLGGYTFGGNCQAVYRAMPD